MPCLLPTISFYFPAFINKKLSEIWGFPGDTGSKEPTCQCSILKAGVLSLGLGGALEEGMATHSSILAWRIPMGRGVW